MNIVRSSLWSLKEKLLDKERRAPVLFTASSMAMSAAGMLAGIVVVHYIAPRDMGLWNSVNLAVTYSFFILAGVQNGLSRELPYYLGANNKDMAGHLAATTLFYTVGGCILALVVVSGTLASYLYYQSRVMGKTIENVKPQAMQMIQTYKQVTANLNHAAISNFVSQLNAYASTHPDFQPVLKKYGWTPAAAPKK